jgi:hypothetical protein
MSHTPGKWCYRTHGNLSGGYHFVVGASDPLTHKMGNGGEHSVCHVIVDDNSEGNAIIIASAPELYEAAKIALSYMETCEGNFAREVEDRLKRSIAKAEGRK